MKRHAIERVVLARTEVAVVANVSLHGFLLAGAWFAEFLRFLEQRGAMERVETVPVRRGGTSPDARDCSL